MLSKLPPECEVPEGLREAGVFSMVNTDQIFLEDPPVPMELVAVEAEERFPCVYLDSQAAIVSRVSCRSE